jgi:hypothetical protein
MKHKYIKTPEELYILFEKYKNSLVEREIQKATAGGVKTEKHKPPLTISGFRVYGHKNGFSIEHYFANTGNAYEDYRTICKCIEDEIRTDQIEGGMVGQYNPSITQRHKRSNGEARRNYWRREVKRVNEVLQQARLSIIAS